MIALSEQDRDQWLVERGLASYSDYVEWMSMEAHNLPSDAGSKNFLASYISDSFFEEPSEIVPEVTDWSIWPSSDNPELFDEYRASLNESRPLIEAGFHVFSKDEKTSFRNLLNLCLIFFYDVRVFKIGNGDKFLASHDEYFCFDLKNPIRQKFLSEWPPE